MVHHAASGLGKLKANGVELNEARCVHSADAFNFLRHMCSAQGMSIDEDIEGYGRDAEFS